VLAQASHIAPLMRVPRNLY